MVTLEIRVPARQPRSGTSHHSGVYRRCAGVDGHASEWKQNWSETNGLVTGNEVKGRCPRDNHDTLLLVLEVHYVESWCVRVGT